MSTRMVRLVVGVVLLLPLLPVRPQPTFAAALVNPTNVYVSNFEGWGTSLAWWSNALNSTNRDALADLIFGVNGLRLNIVRYNIGGSSATQQGMRPGGLVRSYINADGSYNWTVDANQRWWLSAARARGANIVEGFSNSPPWFMTNTGDTRGGTNCGDNLRSGQEDAFAEYLTEVTRHFRDSWGVTFRTLVPFNEPMGTWWCGPGSGTVQEGAHINRMQQDLVALKVGQKLAAKGLSGTRLAAPDESAPSTTIGTINAYGSTTKSYISQINTHTYGTNATDNANLRSLATSLGKRLWMSEVDGTAGSTHSHTSIAPGLSLAARITEDMNYMRPDAWIFWQIVEEEGNQSRQNKNWGAIHAEFSGSQNYWLTKKYYGFGNYSKFIRPGAQIIASGDSRTVAAYHPTAGTLTLVIHNNTTSSSTVTWDLSRFGSVSGPATPYRTSGSENLAQLASIPIANKQFTATANANSITTYVITGVSMGGPTVTPTATAGGPSPTPGGPTATRTATSTTTYTTLVARHSGKAADVSGSSLADGANVIQWTINGGANQQWQFQAMDSGYYRVVNRNSGKCLDVTSASTADGARVLQWSCGTGSNQQWRINDLGTGYIQLIARHSNKCLDVTSASTADGAQLQQWTCHSSTNQQWQRR